MSPGPLGKRHDLDPVLGRALSDRCTGHCCRDFNLPHSIAEFKRAADAVVAGSNEWCNDAGDYVPLLPDAVTIAPMLVLNMTGEYGDGKPAYFYSCTNLEPNGDCGIYESRPRFCRTFPDGAGCTFDGCTDPRVRLPDELVAPRFRLPVLVVVDRK